MSNFESKKTIFIVDDSPENVAVINNVLKERYKTKIATHPLKALETIMRADVKPDLILLDILMPEMDGYAVCEKLKYSMATKDIPIIFLTSLKDCEDEEKGLRAGAVDFIQKPISPSILLARVSTHLKLKEVQDFQRLENVILENMVKERTQQLEESHHATMVAMGSLAESRDPETGAHIFRTQYYVKLLAETLYLKGLYSDTLDRDYIKYLFKAAPLHDIGKVAIPDHILLKCGPLTDEEFDIMKTHTLMGERSIKAAIDQMELQNDFFFIAQEVIATHHEKWDGSGYPNGLIEDQIPLGGRIMAIADVYDALRSSRPYKEGFSHEKACGIIMEQKGRHFDPVLCDTFEEIAPQFASIFERYTD